MSRVGKVPVSIPEGVKVILNEDRTIDVSGKLGNLSSSFPPEVTFAREENSQFPAARLVRLLAGSN